MKVMLLAAGRGERMGPLTETTPKPLLRVSGKPLLEHHLARLKAAGFNDIVINTAYLGEQIRDFVGDGAQWGLQITCTTEPERLETAGGIYNALPLLGDAPFLVVNSDIWVDYPLAGLRNVVTQGAHLVLVNNPEHNPEGDFHFCEATQRVSSSGQSKLTFSGLSVLSPLLFANCQPGRAPLAPLLRRAMAEGLVSGEHYQGIWVDVGTPARLAQLATLINLFEGS